MLDIKEIDDIIEVLLNKPEDDVLLESLDKLRGFSTSVNEELTNSRKIIEDAERKYENLRTASVNKFLGRDEKVDEASDTTANNPIEQAEPEIVDENASEEISINDIIDVVKDEREGI